MPINPADISYAGSAQSKSGRVVIRTMETLSGRHALLRRARGFEAEIDAGANFFEVMTSKFGIQIELLSGDFNTIPSKGPLILVSNHPYGILDGLVLGAMLAQKRADYRILANHVFKKAGPLHDVILPIDFSETKEAVKVNLDTRNQALRFLDGGGAIGIFPGGTVSTAPKPFAKPLDPRWRPFTAKLISKTNATVIPLFFQGANSRVFQVASHLHQTLRMSLLVNEFRRARKAPVRLAIGKPLERAELNAYSGDPLAMMDFLRESTYRLSPKPLPKNRYGFEFEKHYR